MHVAPLKAQSMARWAPVAPPSQVKAPVRELSAKAEGMGVEASTGRSRHSMPDGASHVNWNELTSPGSSKTGACAEMSAWVKRGGRLGSPGVGTGSTRHAPVMSGQRPNVFVGASSSFHSTESTRRPSVLNR